MLKFCAAALLGLAALSAHAAQVTTSTLLGVVVLNAQGERLGIVRDLAVDVSSGTVAYAIVEYREPSALRPDLRPVPLAALRPALAPDRLVLEPSAASGGSRVQPDARLRRASTVLGMKVEHPTGTDYGVIEDVVVDLETARVQHVMVRLDAGVPRQVREVPFGALRFPVGSSNALLTLGG
jgi:sporulation protein YlmC with PRC-barrel domain